MNDQEVSKLSKELKEDLLRVTNYQGRVSQVEPLRELKI